MFDHVAPNVASGLPFVQPPCLGTPAFDPVLPFLLTRTNTNLGAILSGEARPVSLARFASLIEAKDGAIFMAEDLSDTPAPLILAILDSDERLVLAGLASAGAVAWCHPVMSAAEARAVVSEASQLRAQAGRATDWSELDLAQRLRQRADLLDARLVDPLWRAFTARALQIAA
ncbi:DNA repair protein RadC [Tabrizicola sp. M-4]|uniref:DNA repair protein RadC n=1 Tax=Tabrizicola sp. M-4 TaxID=3055847 RepID=UPI003DA935E4